MHRRHCRHGAALLILINRRHKALGSARIRRKRRKLSLLGYLFTNQVSGTIPLYRTYNSRTGIYSATTNANAPGEKLLLGYLFPPVGDETFAYRYDATEQTEVVNGGAETVPFTRTGQQGYDNWFFAGAIAVRRAGPAYLPTGQRARVVSQPHAGFGPPRMARPARPSTHTVAPRHQQLARCGNGWPLTPGASMSARGLSAGLPPGATASRF